MSTVQFYIPRAAADALLTERALPTAQAAGVPNAHLEYSTLSAGPSRMRITCSIEMARYVVDRLTDLGKAPEGRYQTWLIIDCTHAVKAGPTLWSRRSTERVELPHHRSGRA